MSSATEVLVSPLCTRERMETTCSQVSFLGHPNFNGANAASSAFKLSMDSVLYFAARCRFRWQLAHRTSHFSISRLSASHRPILTRKLMVAFLSPRWSNSKTRTSVSPQPIHGWNWRYSRTMSLALSRLRLACRFRLPFMPKGMEVNTFGTTPS